MVLPLKGESLETWGFRKMLNVWPCYWGTGGKVTYIARDWSEARIGLSLSLRTRNYVGTIFGGSLYAAIDPMFMLMLIKSLGPDYIVWDKAASIQFKRPGVGKLEALCVIPPGELDTIRELAARERSIDRIYTVEFKDREGRVCASIEKTIYVRRKARA